MEEVQYRISPRQFQRLIILETGSIGCLFITVWSGLHNGLLTVMLSMIGGIIYGGLFLAIGRTGGGYFPMTERYLSGFLWRFIWVIYILRFVIRGAWILSYLEYLIKETLFDGSRLMIIIPLILVCTYAGMRNLEGRARFVELMFWLVIIPLGLLFMVGLWKIDLENLVPDQEVRIRELFRDDYGLMVLFLPLEFLLFRSATVEGTNRKIWSAGILGVLVTGFWFLLVYVVTIGILGPVWGHESWLSVTDAMELISLKGGGLERIDILMILFWLIGGIVTLSAYVFQGQQLLNRVIPVQKYGTASVIFMALMIFAVSFCFSNVSEWSTWYFHYACMIDFPLSLILPVFIWCVYRFRTRKEGKQILCQILTIVMIGVSCLGLTGCEPQESLEDRTYVESLHISQDGDHYQYQCVISYMKQDTWKNLKTDMEGAIVTEEDTEESVEREYTATAEDMEDFNQEYYRLTGSHFDYSHLQGIYLDASLYQPDAAKDVLLDIWEETQVVLSTPIYREGTAIGDQKEESLGDWLNNF